MLVFSNVAPTQLTPSARRVIVRVRKLKILQSFLESRKNYNNSKSNYKREEIFKLKFPLCLVLGSSRGGRKWFLFSVDRVNVKLLQHLSPWTTDGVAQLLSNGISKKYKKNLQAASFFFKSKTLLILSLDSLCSTAVANQKFLTTPPFQ